MDCSLFEISSRYTVGYFQEHERRSLPGNAFPLTEICEPSSVEEVPH